MSAPASAFASATASRSDSTPSLPLTMSAVVVTVIVGLAADTGPAATTTLLMVATTSAKAISTSRFPVSSRTPAIPIGSSP